MNNKNNMNIFIIFNLIFVMTYLVCVFIIEHSLQFGSCNKSFENIKHLKYLIVCNLVFIVTYALIRESIFTLKAKFVDKVESK
jgi:hypothetical protein